MILSKNRRIICAMLISIMILIFWISVERISIEKRKIVDDVPELFFSHETGFYEEEFDLIISAVNGEIYYTLDGSVPTRKSIPYTQPIHIADASNNPNVYSTRTDISTGFLSERINEYSKNNPQYQIPGDKVDKCTVVRAVVFYGDESYSDVKTAAYFIGFSDKPEYKTMNVISIVSDPDNLFGYENGIYVTGHLFDDFLCQFSLDEKERDWRVPYWQQWPANYRNRGREFEREANIQFFDKDKEIILSQKCGIRIHGESSRGYNPKSLNLYARESYDGHDNFMTDFWNNGYFPSKVTLFQGGQDERTKIKDYVVSRLTEKLQLATMDFEPYVLFLDGEYWGVYWLTEKYDENYINFHYGVDKDNVIIIKNGEVETGETEDLKYYQETMEYCSNIDLTSADNYEKVCEQFDMESMIDYYASLIYIARYGDWPGNNMALWRSRVKGNDAYSDAKWRWMIFDVNSSGFNAGSAEHDSIGNAIECDALFANLMTNENFREDFLNRIIEMRDTIYSKENVDCVISKFQEIMDEPMEENCRRFFGENSEEKYFTGVEDIKNFFDQRREYVSKMVEIYK